LMNRMLPSDECEPWQFGLSAMMSNLAKRNYL
jgi:fumarylacetoacetate (FAA) hydrolase family protein